MPSRTYNGELGTDRLKKNRRASNFSLSRLRHQCSLAAAKPFAMLQDLLTSYPDRVFQPIQYPSVDRLVETTGCLKRTRSARPIPLERRRRHEVRCEDSSPVPADRYRTGRDRRFRLPALRSSGRGHPDGLVRRASRRCAKTIAAGRRSRRPRARHDRRADRRRLLAAVSALRAALSTSVG